MAKATRCRCEFKQAKADEWLVGTSPDLAVDLIAASRERILAEAVRARRLARAATAAFRRALVEVEAIEAERDALAGVHPDDP